MKSYKFSLSVLTAAGLLIAHTQALAHGEDSYPDQVNILQQQLLSNAPGKQALMLTVSYAPGQASPPHQHPGAVMAYVLEGAVVSRINDVEQTFQVGEYWYEAPGTIHSVSRNASKTQPAKLLVWALKDEEQQLSIPLK